jgi:hypothetical protein
MVILKHVENFGAYPDGRLRMGPFSQGHDQIEEILSRYDLNLSITGRNGVCSRTMQGIMISCSGDDVFGYLLGEDGIEAPSSDMEQFLSDVMAPGSTFNIEGHHCPDEDRMIISNSSAWMLNGDIKVACNRYVESRDGSRITIHRQSPMSVTRSSKSDDRAFCLVG